MSLFDRIFRRPAEPEGPPPSRLAELAAEFPFPLSAHHGASVEADLLALRAAPADPRGLAVIVGDHVRAGRLLDTWDEPFSMEEQSGLLDATDFPRWVEDQKASDPEYGAKHQLKVCRGGINPMTALAAGKNDQGHLLAEVFIAYLPAGDPALIPLHLRYGDWNACPSPYLHAAAARFWGQRFGASIVTLAGDIIEYEVTRPPASEAEAVELAWQQYFYCPHIVHQRAGSVASLAKALPTSSRWFFWWD